MVTIKTKDVGEVKDIYSGKYKKGLEEMNEDYIKGELEVDG